MLCGQLRCLEMSILILNRSGLNICMWGYEPPWHAIRVAQIAKSLTLWLQIVQSLWRRLWFGLVTLGYMIMYAWLLMLM